VGGLILYTLALFIYDKATVELEFLKSRWLRLQYSCWPAVAEKSWRRLHGHNPLPKVGLGVRFTDGVEVVRSQPQAAAA